MTTIKIRWTVEELTNVMTVWDTQKVYRSTAGDSGPWSEITGVSTRVDLVAGQTDYYFDDTSGDTSYYYAVAYYNSSSTAESDKSTALSVGISPNANYLCLVDLYNLIGSDRVRQFFDDDIDGSITDETPAVDAILTAAEAEAASHMLRAYNEDAITDLANNDPAFKRHAAWVAIEFASERRSEFLQSDGKGGYWSQYERAIDYFRNLSKGKKRSLGESEAGQGDNTGGNLQPTLDTSTQPRFTFAPCNNAKTGHGGF